MTATQLLKAYEEGAREFHEVDLDSVDLSDRTLQAASFYGASLRGANLARASLTYIQLKGADLTEANLSEASLNATDLIAANFSRAKLDGADLTGAAMNRADFTDASISNAFFGNAVLENARLLRADLERCSLSSTNLTDLDVSSFCNAKHLRHTGPSYVDARTVMRTYQHPGLKPFLLDCGLPPIFSDYMIDCARSIAEPLMRRLMQSTFISYGGPDESFARKVYESLREHGVVVFFFPEGSTVGERIDAEVFRRIHEHDRVILICSQSSLDRPGVLHEVRETLDRESKDGGATYLLPITIDDYVFTGWAASEPELAMRVKRRIVGDFRQTRHSRARFNQAMDRLLDALRVRRPATHEGP